MTLKINLGFLLPLAYVAAGILTWAYVWNHSTGIDRCYVDKGVQHDCFTDDSLRVLVSITDGVVWPIYWAGIKALEVTK